MKNKTKQRKKTAKARKPRVMAKPRPKQRLNARRTTTTIINDLSKQMAKTHMGGYVGCRLDPFHSAGGLGIPDGGNSNFIVTDNMSVDNFSAITSTGFTIQTIPALPCAALIAPRAGTMFVNGTQVTAPIQDQPNSALKKNSWYPISIPASFQNAAGAKYNPGVLSSDPYGSSKGRAISFGYRLIYTGPVNSCAGVITVSPNDASFHPLGTVQTGSISINGPSEAFLVASPVGTPLLAMDIIINPTAVTRASISFRPEQGVMLLPRHMTNDYKIIPTCDVPYAVLAESIYDPSAIGGFYDNIIMADNPVLASTKYNGGIIWYDNDWSGFQLVASGLNADATFRWETVVCFEYNPAVTSPFAATTLKSSPKSDQALNTANAATSALPTATDVRG